MTTGVFLGVALLILILFGVVARFGSRMEPRSEWPTRVTPLASIFVALLSLFTTWIVFLKSAEATRNASRPFVSLEYAPLHPLTYFRGDKGMTDTFGTTGVVTLTNVGNTPAYDVRPVLSDGHLTCSLPSKDFFVLPHVPKKYLMRCIGKDPKFSLDLLGVRYLTGNIFYRDASNFQFSEALTVTLCVGPLDNDTCKANMMEYKR